MAPLSDDSFKQAIASFQAGKLTDAEQHFKKVLRLQPNHVAALNFLSVLLTSLGRYAEAESYIISALGLNSHSDATLCNYGIILKSLNRPVEALERFSQALLINPTVAETWNNRGTIHNIIKRYDDAIIDFNKAISLQPNFSAAYFNKGKSLAVLKRYDEAIAAFAKALSLKPDLAEAWLGRGNVFFELKRHDEAIAAYDRALAIKPDLEGAWLGRGNVLFYRKHYDEAFASYDKVRSLKAELIDVWLGCGNALFDLKRYDQAIAAYDKALAIKPDLEGAWLGRGNVLFERKRHDEAIAAYDRALAIKPDLEGAWLGRGNVLFERKHYDEAFASYDKAILLKPDLFGADASRLYVKMYLCDWNNYDAECEHLISSIRNGNVITPPFALLALPSSCDDQLQYSKLWIKNRYPPSHKPIWQSERYNHDRIRVAYVSADFRQHPVSSLIAGMFECHNKSRFDVTAISLGRDDNSELRQRLKSSFENFIDAKTLGDEQIANLVRSSEIDILIDLLGFTTKSRTDIFAFRPAPIQVNYLGYPGTMGANYIDYIIGDPTVIPDDCRKFYSEKIVTLPNTYQVNDRKRGISDKAITRSDVGLPSNGFVFCCFNNNYKITPRVFNSWMRILRQVEGSLLWLLEANVSAASNLEKEAVAQGVNTDRLVFAKPMPPPEHLARHRLADLFLDTLPYNAHTTASDALWAGLPVLTCLGETFAGRVAASLLNAVRLPELITTTLEAYEKMAIDLATHPEKMAAIKRKLTENRLTTPLFDTELFTTHIEAAYTMMYERYQADLLPNHFVVPD